jgi:hypothetical protein
MARALATTPIGLAPDGATIERLLGPLAAAPEAPRQRARRRG